MQPIISPWIIYFINLTESLILVMAIIAIPSLICLLINLDYEQFKYRKTLLIIIVISLLAVVLVPNKQTCYKMLITSYITTDSVKARDIIKAIVEPGTDSIIKVQKEEESKNKNTRG